MERRGAGATEDVSQGRAPGLRGTSGQEARSTQPTASCLTGTLRPSRIFLKRSVMLSSPPSLTFIHSLTRPFPTLGHVLQRPSRHSGETDPYGAAFPGGWHPGSHKEGGGPCQLGTVRGRGSCFTGDPCTDPRGQGCISLAKAEALWTCKFCL